MSFSISRVQGPPTIEAPQNSPKKENGAQFANVLESAIDQVERSRHNAADSIRQLLSGEKEEIHSTVLATQQAELQFEMFLQVRNKVVSAYQEVMKMQV